MVDCVHTICILYNAQMLQVIHTFLVLAHKMRNINFSITSSEWQNSVLQDVTRISAIVHQIQLCDNTNRAQTLANTNIYVIHQQTRHRASTSTR